MDIGVLRAIFEADTSHFDAGAPRRCMTVLTHLEGSIHKVTEVLHEAVLVMPDSPLGLSPPHVIVVWPEDQQ
jgi:hypothetical protein